MKERRAMKEKNNMISFDESYVSEAEKERIEISKRTVQFNLEPTVKEVFRLTLAEKVGEKGKDNWWQFAQERLNRCECSNRSAMYMTSVKFRIYLVIEEMVEDLTY